MTTIQQNNYLNRNVPNISDDKLDQTEIGNSAATIITTNDSNYNNNNYKLIRRIKNSKLWNKFNKEWPFISQSLILFIIFLLLWAIGYSLMPEYFQLNSNIMNFAYLFIGAQLCGNIVQLCYLPDMLGMLAFGIIFINLNTNAFKDTFSHSIQAFLRKVALVNIMTLVGLGLHYKALKMFFGLILRLTIIPILAEVAVIATLAIFLFSFPLLWAILMGLVITAVSPNVVVSVMLELQKKNLGIERGIHTIVYGMTAIGDVLAILLFQILLEVIISTDSIQKLILTNVIGIGIGILSGLFFGCFLVYIPHNNTEYANALRFLSIILGGILIVVGTEAINCSSGGALGCTIFAFIAGEGWNRRELNNNGNKTNYTSENLQLMWLFFKPISFSLIGIEVNFSRTDPNIFGFGILIIFIGVLFRSFFAYVSMFGKYLKWKERAYITVCGLPKATIQAALGPVALDVIRDKTIVHKIQSEDEHSIDPKSETYAKTILITSVSAIVLTAPLGAILMTRLASKWLKDSSNDQELPQTRPSVEVESVENNSNVP